MSFNKWQKRLRGEKVMTFTSPTIEDEGFYRKPVTVKQPNGQNKIIDWIPVAYFIESYGTEDRLVGCVGDRDMTDSEIDELWTWCVKYPISEETYRAVAERGEPWPDVVKWYDRDKAGKIVGESVTVMPAELTGPGPAVLDQAAEAEVTALIVDDVIGPGHNNPPPEEAVPPEVLLADKIDNAIKAAPDLKAIESDEQAALVLGSRNRVLELKNEAEGIRKKQKAPFLEGGRKVDGTWQPIVSRAETAAFGWATLIRKWEQKKRDDAQAAAEAAQRAADRAIAAGIPETAPVVQDAPPAPKAQVTATYGRAMSVQEKTFVVIDDWDAVIKHFRDSDELTALVQRLAQRATDAGITVPGTHTRKGVI